MNKNKLLKINNENTCLDIDTTSIGVILFIKIQRGEWDEEV